MVFFLPAEYSKALEIGCGEGGFRGNLNPGAEVWGIEPDPGAAAAAREKFHRVLAGTYDGVYGEIPDNYFDLVIANDVIEHLPDHDAFFDSIQRKMVSGGRLVASIPNVRHWRILRELIWKKDWRYTDAGILDRTHLRVFTGKSLRRALAAHEFTIEKFGGINRMEFKRKNLFPYFLRLATLGYYGDILYYQFGFCARKK
jgi:SAM-dependent methyltransferase